MEALALLAIAVIYFLFLFKGLFKKRPVKQPFFCNFL